LLRKYLVWDPTPLELMEDNHFLRILEHGVKMKAVEIDNAKISVDTKEDLEEIRGLMKKDELRFEYN
jgi:CMP-2-keto-3-deoxyoctulosonic acid synthetase